MTSEARRLVFSSVSFQPVTPREIPRFLSRANTYLCNELLYSTMLKKKLPIGIQTFRDIRDPKENYVYVDKTELALSLITSLKYVFLSRPRRFGKSLFLDTLSEIFKGSEELFRGLAIHDQWDWSENYPVINISFGSGNFSSREATVHKIEDELLSNARLLNITGFEFDSIDTGISLKRLITAAYEQFGKKVVILIDEYDKPILDTIHHDDKTATSDARDMLRDFYSAIKASDAFVKFVFLTGVSKFAKLTLFSGLNNLMDITINPNYATITGYTHEDLVREFATRLDGVDLDEVKRWYNGYNYFGTPIYNPYDILLFLENGCMFKNYWWETGNPLFLIEILKKEPKFIPNLETITISDEMLNAFDIERISLPALLWQNGYLTFGGKQILMGEEIYELKVPNIEIQRSLNALFLDYLTNLYESRLPKMIDASKNILADNLDGFKTALVSLFASIPYHNYANNIIASFEGYYASVTFAFLASLGFDIVAEETTNIGRIDMTIKAPDKIFIIEFKVDVPAEAALHQCRTRRYHEKYLADGRPIALVGIHFDSQLRNIAGFAVEEVAR